MTHRPPEYCRVCGTALEAVAPPTVHRCPTCAEYRFHNPVPNCRVVVVDGERALLVEILDEHRLGDAEDPPPSEWMFPGGHPTVDEQPEEAAARELAEETNLAVDPADLVLFDAVSRQVVEENHALVLCYAVDRARTEGPLRADSDAGDAQFFTPDELGGDRRFREMAVEPERCRSVEWWTTAAREALDGA